MEGNFDPDELKTGMYKIKLRRRELRTSERILCLSLNTTIGKKDGKCSYPGHFR